MNRTILKIIRHFRDNLRFFLQPKDPEHTGLITQIRKDKLTYLSKAKMHAIAVTIMQIKQNKVIGTFMEAGCALGGSTILIARLKDKHRPLNVYDVFETIPAPSINDDIDVWKRYQTIIHGKSKGIKGDKYYGYTESLFDTVKSNLARFDIDLSLDNVELFQGLVQETLKITTPVAFAHIDVDWYEPVKFCLEEIIPNLSDGGSVILDDYLDWSGCRKAVDQYFIDINNSFKFDTSSGSLIITRQENK